MQQTVSTVGLLQLEIKRHVHPLSIQCSVRHTCSNHAAATHSSSIRGTTDTKVLRMMDCMEPVVTNNVHNS